MTRILTLCCLVVLALAAAVTAFRDRPVLRPKPNFDAPGSLSKAQRLCRDRELPYEHPICVEANKESRRRFFGKDDDE